MKQIIIFISILTIFGCSSEESSTETVEKTLTSSITLNENSSVTSNYGDFRTYETALLFHNIPGQTNATNPRIKKITINQVSYTVTSYACSLEEINASITWYNENGAAHFSLMKMGNGLSNFLYPSKESTKAALEKDLLSPGFALTYVSCTLPKEISSFDVRLTFTMDVTIESFRD